MKPDYLKMLIVDDDPLISKMVKDYFSVDHNYEFFQAEDGETALELAKKELPDIVITDIMLPKKTGIELIKELRAMDDFAVMPIVAITAGDEVIQENAKQAGASLIITKPFRRIELVEKIDTLVGATPFVRKR